MIGQTVGQYQILDLLSVGGMGTIYRAQHTLLGRLAAIKVLNPELSTNRDVVNRFFNEARATTSIRHPGIVEVFDYGYMPSGDAYLVMELLEGMSLAQRIKLRGVMPEGEAALYMRGVATALAAAHAQGIVHRDLKPDNVFLVTDPEAPMGERVKLLDFGIAKLSSIGAAGSATRTGAVLGTPTYMSPEQCKGTGEVDHRADLYSIGCMLYELVAGRPPFVRDGAGELIGAHLFLEPEPVARHAQVSADFDALVTALLQKQPERRVQTARELADRLGELAQRHYRTAVATPFDLRASSASLPISFTPAPPSPTPAPPVVPSPTPVHQAPTQILTEKPTTLSGAASMMTPVPGPVPTRTRRGLVIGGVAAGASVLAIVLVLALGGGKGGSSGEPAPTATEPVKPAAAPPAPEPPKPDPAPPAPAPAPPTPAPAAAVVDPAPPVPAPAPTPAPAEVATPGEGSAVAPKKPAKPRPPKPAKPKPGTDPLLETDL